ncbi:hypothetical protein Tco_1142715 [Tanacetum coccineum]
MEEDAEKEELKGFLDIIPREEVPIEVESISTKFPIMDWKTCVLTETFMYYQVFRGDVSSKNYKILSEMLEDFDRLDVEELYRLVKERYSASRPEGFDLMLWGDLHTLFEPDEDDEIWKDQHEYNLISWRLCDFCGIHILLMENGLAIHMLTEKKYPLSQEMLTKMLSRKLEVDHESSQAFELISINGVSTASTNLVLPVLINTASRKKLVLLMVKAAELKIRMHGDYYGMVIFELFTPLVKTPKEILAMDTMKFKAPLPMSGPTKNRNKNKFCEFHGDKGHSTDECIHLKKQIKEADRSGKLSHLIKKQKQGSKKGEH